MLFITHNFMICYRIEIILSALFHDRLSSVLQTFSWQTFLLHSFMWSLTHICFPYNDYFQMKAEIIVATDLSSLWNSEFLVGISQQQSLKNVHSGLEPYLTIIVVEKLFLSLSGEFKDMPFFLVDLSMPSYYVFFLFT